MMLEIWEWCFFAGELLGVLFIPVVLVRKKQPVSAVAWSLTVFFIPYLGILLFLIFGASSVKRRLRHKLYHRSQFLRLWVANQHHTTEAHVPSAWAGMDSYALRVGGAPPSEGNDVAVYRDGVEAFEAKFEAIRAAIHHVHLEYFILHDDTTGRSLVELLCEKARKGVMVRLLVDAIGSRGVNRLLQNLRQAGGQTAFFLPPRFYKPRFTVGLRNHRKILVCDGKVGFVGGLNIGDEYLGKVPFFGYWRDTHLRVVGPAVLALQRVFVEDWDFAADMLLSGDSYFPKPVLAGDVRLQVVWSGPDQENNASREVYFAAITASRRKLWISTPYLVPDSALLAGLRAAALRGVDVRILTQSYPPDHWLTYWAGRYFWEDMMSCGVRIFEYRKGMFHAKVMLADDAWASVGSSNLDIRSIRLNFEVNCHVHTQRVVAQLEEMFLQDLANSGEVNLGRFRRRSWRGRLAENVCRLFSPLL